MKPGWSAKTLPAIAIGIAGYALGACAFKEYSPQPLAAETVIAEYGARSLQAPDLRDYMRTHGFESKDWPLRHWGLPELTLLAFYYSPELRLATARAEIARAHEFSARQPFNPALQVGAEHHSVIDRGSPWSLGFEVSIPFVTMNKRKIAVEQAGYLARATALDVGAAAWKLRSQLRARFIEHFVAAEELTLLQAESQARDEEARLLENRLNHGMISASELGLARRTAADVSLRLLRQEGELELARSRLAAAVALPESQLRQIAFSKPGLELPPTADFPAFKRAALTNRLDVRRSLLEYAASEAALQLEIARQYPDFDLKPGYLWDQRDNIWSLAVGLLLPVMNRNQGPIAEAEARRDAKAQEFTALQTEAIAATDLATLKYQNALAETAAAERLERLLRQQDERIERQFADGNVDRLDRVNARLQLLAARSAMIDARRKMLAAVGELEDVLQRPVFGAFAVPEFNAAKGAH